MRRIVLPLFVLAATTMIGCVNMPTNEKMVHVLQSPLRIASAQQQQYYFLPAGTMLYYDTSTAEGADRFYVYVNVEGKPLPLVTPPRPDYISPITAYRPEKADIVGALNDYPVSKADLERMLSATPLSSTEALEIANRLIEYANRPKKVE